MKQSLSSVVVVLGMIALGCASSHCPNIGATGEAALRQVRIASTAQLNVAPNAVCVEMTFSEQAPTIAEAHRMVEAVRAAAIAALSELDGVRVETGSTRYTPEYDHREDVEHHLVGYRASFDLTARTSDLARVPTIVEAYTSGLHVVNVRHYHDSLDSFRSRLREMAIEAARVKAEEFAAGFGTRVVRVHSIEEGANSTHAHGSAYSIMNVVANASGMQDSDEPAPPGALPLTTTITVAFEIE